MTTVTLSTFPLPDRSETYWQVFLNGMPVTRETTSQTDATVSFRRVAAEQRTHGRKVALAFWDGYNRETTPMGGM